MAGEEFKLLLISSYAKAADILPNILDVLGDCELCSISTLLPAGEVHINTAFFAFDDRANLFFLSDPDSTHSNNIKNNPKVAVTVFNSHQKWTSSLKKGIQLFGNCKTSNDCVKYKKRFPEYEPSEDYQMYKIYTQRIKLLDEEAFGEESYKIWKS